MLSKAGRVKIKVTEVFKMAIFFFTPVSIEALIEIIIKIIKIIISKTCMKVRID